MILGTIKHLQMVHLVPEDMTNIVMKIYSTCSVDLFQQLIQVLVNSTRISGVDYTLKEVCAIAECNYWSLEDSVNEMVHPLQPWCQRIKVTSPGRRKLKGIELALRSNHPDQASQGGAFTMESSCLGAVFAGIGTPHIS
jgi:hypothetical protein